ncbi:protein N5-glutamine methyltransferase [Natrialba magadii ATCC 43099]|uniref:Methyltransferase n=2 Tax=Natrialba magadii TaxID=13769 RepID=D3SRH1_NATMM|nr:protein N5-glutamine methyltransferase [Natrialba magadii ATCC 43099]ELY25332.1 methyltransferase [Natrialba magadii ATCC 43099]
METEVYQPAEDSELLAEAACSQLSKRGREGPDATILEVGTGSGYVANRVADETGARVIASDLNPHAVRQARSEGSEESSEKGTGRSGAVETVRADLVSPFADDTFDAVLFNPPYLPTEPENEWDDWMEHALSGGEDGRAVIDPFLASVGRVLAPDGVVYLLVSSLTGVDEVVERAGEEGFSAVAIADESFPFETLTVLELHY